MVKRSDGKDSLFSTMWRRDIEHARLLMAKIDKTKNPVQRLRLATEFHTVLYTRAHRPFFLDQASRARNNPNRYSFAVSMRSKA